MAQKFKHIVLFWLKPGISDTDKAAFEKGVKSLGTITSLSDYYLGYPASTDRPVIDSSYDYSLVCTFTDQKAHEAYQADPIHDLFRDTCAVYWDKVLIYDSVDAS